VVTESPLGKPSTSPTEVRRGRRLAVLVAAVLTAVLTASDAGARPVPADSDAGRAKDAPRVCGAMEKFAPRCGAYFGAYTLGGSDPRTSVLQLERKIGRRLDLTLRYHDFSDHILQGKFPDMYETRVGSRKRMLFLSWQARVSDTAAPIRWERIAAGDYDRFIHRAARRVKSWGHPTFIAFDAEFDNHYRDKGSMADYVAAYRRIHDTFRAHRVKNVAWTWVSTGYLGAGNDSRIRAGYPGDDYVDWVGYDPYNFFRCNDTAWDSFHRTVSPTYRWLMANGFGDKPFLLSEYGTQYDPSHPERSVRWHANIAESLENLPNLKGLIRFDSSGYFGPRQCGLSIDNGPGMLESFAEAGRETLATLRR